MGIINIFIQFTIQGPVECCPGWSIGGYIALLYNRTSCFAITVGINLFLEIIKVEVLSSLMHSFGYPLMEFFFIHVNTINNNKD